MSPADHRADARTRWCRRIAAPTSLLAPLTLALAGFAATPALAQRLPTGGTVTAGSATIVQPNSSTLNINQSTNQAIINWNTFSVGRGDTVNFNQPGASSSTLNRVTGSTPSWIAGIINAPGTVLLINPNGIAITKSGVINTGSFVASTLNITDSDYLSGNYHFTGNGGSAGVINNGRINVSDGGFAALLGGQVSNNGIIAARLGTVALGAGEAATLDLSGDGFLSVAVPSSELGKLVDPNGALVSNKGKIIANGGTVFLSAATAANILRNAVNIPGSVQTNTVGTHNGRIVINGGGGTVSVTGKLAANGGKAHSGGNIAITGNEISVSGKVTANGASGGTISIIGRNELALTGTLLAQGFAGQGGEVDLTAGNVTLTGATINASGASGGGIVNIGGGPHATIQLAAAQSVTIDGATTINADATDDGNGGHIVIWSGGLTTALGTLTAEGGPNGGNGGLIETSGQSVDFGGINVNASAAQGTAGTWLIDPMDLTVDQAAANTITNALTGGTNVILQTSADGTASGPGTQSAGNGDINIDASISDFNGSSGPFATLTLRALNDININAGICCSPALSLAMQAGGAVNVNSGIVVSALSIVAQGNITVIGAELSAGAANLTAAGDINFETGGANNYFGSYSTLTSGGSIYINGGTTTGGFALSAYDNILIYGSVVNSGGGTINLNADSFGAGAGTVSLTSNATLYAGGAAVNIFYYPGSANYASPTNYGGSVSGASSLTAYMLINNVSDLSAINANATTLAQTYALATDIDATGSSLTIGPFTGTFNGNDHLISNLTAALFSTNNGIIENVGVGGVISDNTDNYLGALARINNGTISNSFSTASVSDIGLPSYVGDLVGYNAGTITGSYATGSVFAQNNEDTMAIGGGLVGYNGGLVEYSYATGSVHTTSGGSGNSSAGGLVGENGLNATINFSYALGPVNSLAYSGGLVGINDLNGSNQSTWGTIKNSYAGGHVSSKGVSGGLVGWNEYNLNGDGTASSAAVEWSIWNADSTGQTEPFGRSYLDNPYNGQNVSSTNVQYIGFVTANPSVTSASGAQNLGNPYSISSYTVAQNGIFNDPTPGTGVPQISFSNYWYMVNGSTLPFLKAEWSTTIQNAHQLQLMDINTSATYTLARDITYTNDDMWNSTTKFSPITTFNGTLNGNGYTISSLAENTNGAANAGLFDTIGPGGTVENLGIVGGQFTNPLATPAVPLVTQPTVDNAGAIAGINDGKIVNSWASDTTVDMFYSASASANGNPTNGTAGGLVGINNGTISQSYAAVTVSGVDQVFDNHGGWVFYDSDGGLAGVNAGTILNSYAIGNVAGNGTVGGLVGVNSGTIQNTYATGQLFATYHYGINNAGPLVGSNSGTIVSSYWNSDTWYDATTVSAGATNTVGSFDFILNGNANTSAGTGLTTLEMQDLDTFETTYSGWDFTSIWAPPNQAGQGGLSAAYFPQLYADSSVVAIWPGAASMTYGSAVPNFTASVTGLRSSDPTSTVAYSLSTTATSSSNVGSYPIDVTTGYAGISEGGTFPATVTTVAGNQSLDANSSVCDCYGNSSSPIIINGMSVTAGGTDVQVAAALNAALNSHGITATVNNITNAIDLTSTKGAITISGDAADYGIPSGTFQPFTNAPASRNGYGYRVVDVPSTLTITPLALTGTVTISNINKVYDGTSAAPGGSIVITGEDGLPAGVSTTISTTGGTYGGIDVGNWDVTGLTGLTSSNPNYNISGLTVDGMGQITPRPITVTADAPSIIYGNAVPALSYVVTPTAGSGLTTALVNNDTLSGALATTASSTASVGTYAITQGTVTDANNPNYAITYVGHAVTITPRPITVTAGAQTMIYGNAVPALTYVVSPTTGSGLTTGLVNGDTLSGALATTASSTVGIGTYAITQGTVTNGNNPNYAITYASNTVTIAARPITVTADAQTMIYGNAVPALSYAVTPTTGSGLSTGLVNGDTLSGALATTASSTAGIGTYAITQGTVTNGNNQNYAITYAGNAVTIAARPITVTADAQTMIYGNAVPALSYVVTPTAGSGLTAGLVNGDTLSGALATTASSTAGIGTYAITQGTVTNGNNQNYAITYAGNAVTIAARPITVTADAQTMTYGNAVPALSYVVTPTAGFGLTTGLVNGDTLSGALATTASSTANVGNYQITQGTVTNGGNPNYAITYVGNAVTIAPRPITVTADAQSMIYGHAVPALTFAVTPTAGSGLTTALVNGDTLSGALATTANSASNVGAYPITRGTLAASTNYTLSYVGNDVTVTPASVVVTALSGAGVSIYGQSPGNPGLSATGLQNGQSVSVLTGLSNDFGITNFTNVGTYTLNVAGTLTNPNYKVTGTVAGSWTINPATLTYVADIPPAQFTGEPLPTFTGTVTGFVNNETLVSATTGTLLFTSPATTQSPPGTYGIYGSGLTANNGNYVFVQAAGNATALTVQQAPSGLYPPPAINPPVTSVNFTFTTQTNTGNTGNTGTPIHIAFTSNGNTNVADNGNGTDVNPGALATGDRFTHNHGLDFRPISQYDVNQYSGFKLPSYDSLDSEATIFTIIARAIEQKNAANYMIDGFWNGTDNTWPGGGHVTLLDKATFSDGAGHDATPTNDPAFPIVAGKTDFASMLKNGPVMIGGAAGQTPAEWLLAVSLAPDRNGIICDDPITGKLVELAYNPVTETLGGISGIFDLKAKGFVALADSSGAIPAGALDGLATLQSFVPSAYFAVTAH